VFRVMKQLACLAECKIEWIEYFNKSALNFLEQKKNYQVIEKDTFSCAIVSVFLKIISENYQWRKSSEALRIFKNISSMYLFHTMSKI
jgi:hypothetical protein